MVRALQSTRPATVPWQFKLFFKLPFVRDIPAKLIAFVLAASACGNRSQLGQGSCIHWARRIRANCREAKIEIPVLSKPWHCSSTRGLGQRLEGRFKGRMPSKTSGSRR